MDHRALSKLDLSEILDNAIAITYNGGDWYSIFPKITGYKLFIPEGYDDIEEDINTFQGIDHVIARQTVKHTDLHLRVAELVNIITVRNSISNTFMADKFEHAGTSYAIELALCNNQYIKQYADFLLTNDMYWAHCQHFDVVRIIRKWGWCSETYYLLFAHMFTESEHFHNDVNYLIHNGHPLYEGLLENKEEEDRFLASFVFFLKEICHDAENEKLNANAVELFSTLVGKHIISDNPYFPEEKEKSECLKNRVYEVIEKLKNGEEILPENNIPENNLIKEHPEEEIAVLGPENNDTTDITQPSWSWDDEDIPEI